MQTGKVLSTSDVKKILAEYFKVSEDKIIVSKYSYIVLDGEDK